MTRTFGTYQWFPAIDMTVHPARASLGKHRGWWEVSAQPAVAMRLKRVFGRVQQTRTGSMQVAHTREVARDLVWFMDRFPLAPHDVETEQVLRSEASSHRAMESLVGEIMAGTAPRLEVPVTVRKTARDYQLAALDMVRTRGRILLGDEVGLGKTFTSLLVSTLDDPFPMIVVPPTHLPDRWVTELEEAFPDLTVEVARSTVPSKRWWDGTPADVTIVSYSKIAGWAQVLAPLVRTVIFDEAQELRHGVTTAKGTAAAMLTNNAAYVIGATATPVYNYGSEIWNITDILEPGLLGTREEFLREWGGAQMTNGRAVVRNPHALGDYLRESGYLFARTRAQVGRELPKTIKHTMHVDADTTALDAVRGDVEALARMILDTTTTPQERFQAAGRIDWKIRQATGVSKAPMVAEFAKLLLESEHRIVIWAWHRDVYDVLMDELDDYNPRLYTGTESPKQKHAAEKAFTAPWMDPTDPDVTQEDLDGQCRVLIMSLRSGSGVDGLQKVASVGVFAELDWSPQVHEQAIGRLRRDGMGDEPPVAYFLVTDEGSDPALMDVLGLKRQQAEQLMSPDGQLFNNATNDPARGRRLARHILGIPEPETTP